MTVLEKVKLLEKFIAIEANDSVLELALDKLLSREVSRLDDLKKTLFKQQSDFEKKYGMRSTDFTRCYKNGTLGDEMDFMEWAATIDMITNIEKSLALIDKGLIS
ncbi:MAG: hypothetical protein FP814_04615 [Desulfobacterium sp.]|nr:hypothetical protein [Desulfobacterium sp.]